MAGYSLKIGWLGGWGHCFCVGLVLGSRVFTRHLQSSPAEEHTQNLAALPLYQHRYPTLSSQDYSLEFLFDFSYALRVVGQYIFRNVVEKIE